MLISLTPILVTLIIRAVNPTWLFSDRLLNEPGILLPAILAVGIARRDMMGITGVGRDLFRGLLAWFAGGVAYALGMALLGQGASSILPGSTLFPILLGLGTLAYLSAPAVERFRRRALSAPFSVEQTPGEGSLATPARASLDDLEEMMRERCDTLSQALYIPALRAALKSPTGDPLLFQTESESCPAPPGRDQLAAALLWAGELPARPLPIESVADDARLSASATVALLRAWDTRWVVPLRTKTEDYGFAALGPKVGLAEFTREDLAQMAQWARLTSDLIQDHAMRRERSTRERAESALRETERRLRLMAENSRDVIFRFRLNPRLMCEYLSPAAAEITGREPGDFIGRAAFLRRVLDGGDWKRLRALTIGGSEESYELRALRRDGSFRWLEARWTSERDNSGAITAIEGIARDITERKRVEAERAIFESQVRQSQKLEALGTLAAGIAHDFNNALSVVQLHAARAAETWRESGLPENDSLGHVENAVSQARSITKSLLAYARGAPVETSWVALGELIERVFRIQRRLFPSSVEFDLKIADDARPVLIHADEGQIHQALLNLLINARDAMPAGGRVRLGVDWIARQGAGAEPTDEGSAVITIADTGQGIPEEALDRIFEPFFSTKPHSQGSGLGLAMAHGIVTAHGGTIRVQSRPGEGTTFTITLPAALRSAEVEDLAGGRAAGSAGSAPRSETLLVAIPDDYVREAAVSRLADLGYDARGAATAGEAASRIRDPQTRFHLLICDLDSADDFEELLHATRAMNMDPRAILALSGAGGEARNPFAQGHVLLKPFDLDGLASRVSAILNETRVAGRLEASGRAS